MQAPVKILHVFARMDRGGAETMMMNIYRHINRNKIQFDFMVHTEDKCDYDDEIKELGGTIFCVPRFSVKTCLQYIFAWIKFLACHKDYDFVHSHVRSTAVIFLLISKVYGLHTIIHSHSTSDGKGVKALIKTMLSYPLRYSCDYYFSCSTEAGRWLFGEKVLEKSNFFILKNAIQVDAFKFNQATRKKVREEFNFDNKFVVGHVGRFESVKNHKFLLNIFAEVLKIRKNSVLLLVGDGELRDELCGLIEKKKMEGEVMLLGVRNDVSELLQAMDVFVFPSLYEGLPVTLIEAQASGLPCFVSDVITQDVSITNFVRFVSLEKSACDWGEKIINNCYMRKDESLAVKKAGYDIEMTTKFLEQFYLKK